MRLNGLMSDGKDLNQPVVVKLRVSEPGLPYDHEKETEIEPSVWYEMDPAGREEHIEALLAEFAAEVYETDWEIVSDHDLTSPGLDE